MKLINKIKNINFATPDIYFMRLLSAFCLTAITFFIWTKGNFQKIESVFFFGLIDFVIIFAVSFILITLLALPLKKFKFNILILPITFGIYSFMTLLIAEDWYFAFCICALAAILIYFYSQKGYLKDITLSKTAFIVCTVTVSVIFITVCGSFGVMRYNSYSTPNFDFGIFCNMFYNMRDSFRAVTTCERDKLLSHFAVHISPIYYLLLPVYYIFPSPVTLQLSQTFILASAVIPVCLLARHFEISYAKTALISAAVLLHPAVFAGTGYDLHENCFLLPLLLWMFYFFEKNKFLPTAAFAVLCLAVKEDAAVYVIFFALYIFLARKKRLWAIVLAFIAAVYFVFTLVMLSKYGDGVMAGRYGNYISDGDGLFAAVKNVLIDPGYVFTQLFVDKNGDYAAKLLFILQLFVPLGFLPFAVKKISNLLLIMPMILINLMTVYVYQYNIGFQYAFAPLAFIFYLMILNVKDMPEEKRGLPLKIAAVCAALLFVSSGVQRTSAMFDAYTDHRAEHKIMDEALDAIPEDASVVCSTFLLPHLSQRKEIYEVYYHKNRPDEVFDYVILDARYKYQEPLEKYSDMGYYISDTVKGKDGNNLIIIMEKEK